MEITILRGVTPPTGESLSLHSDGQGNTFGMIGAEKLMIIRAQGMAAGKLGNRRLICVEGGPGVTVCK